MGLTSTSDCASVCASVQMPAFVCVGPYVCLSVYLCSCFHLHLPACVLPALSNNTRTSGLPVCLCSSLPCNLCFFSPTSLPCTPVATCPARRSPSLMSSPLLRRQLGWPRRAFVRRWGSCRPGARRGPAGPASATAPAGARLRAVPGAPQDWPHPHRRHPVGGKLQRAAALRRPGAGSQGGAGGQSARRGVADGGSHGTQAHAG